METGIVKLAGMMLLRSGVVNMSKEYVDYRTQKPEALIKQLIKQLSNKNNMILDFFGGRHLTKEVLYIIITVSTP